MWAIETCPVVRCSGGRPGGGRGRRTSSYAAPSFDHRRTDLAAALDLQTERPRRSLVYLGSAEAVDRPMLGRAHEPGAGLSGTLDSGRCSRAATSAGCATSSATPTLRTIRASPAIRRTDPIRQTASMCGPPRSRARWIVGAAPPATGSPRPAPAGVPPCSRSSGVNSSPKSSASKTGRISMIASLPGMGIETRLTTRSPRRGRFQLVGVVIR